MMQKLLERFKEKPLLSVAVIIGIIIIVYALYPVRVESGKIVNCRYGELLTDDVKTVVTPRIFAGRYGVVKEEILCDRHKRAEKLYEEAKEEFKAGKMEEAKEKIAEVAKIDPAFRPGKVSTPPKTQTPAVTPGGGTPAAPSAPAAAGTASIPPATTGTAGTGTGGVSRSEDDNTQDITGLLMEKIPGEIQGYNVFFEEEGLLAAGRVFQPDTTSSNMIILTVYLEYHGTDAKASAALTQDVGSNPQVITSGGRTYYYYTNNSDRGLLGWVDDGILFEVEGVTKTAPSGLLEELKIVAELVG